MNLKATRGVATGLLTLAYALTACLGLTGLVVMFFRHLSPDPAVFVVFARDTLAGIPRFAGHFDSKGAVWNWLVLGGMVLFGVRFAAIALIQLFGYLCVAVCLAVGGARVYGLRAALVASVLWLALAFTPAMDGAGGRPEDALVALSALAWLAALKLTRVRAGGVGVLAGVALAVKVTGGAAIALFVFGVILTAFHRTRRERVILTACVVGGLAVSYGLVAVIVAMTDDLGAMIYQTLIYPRQYAASHWTAGLMLPITKAAMLLRIQMLVPLGFALVGGWLLWRSADGSVTRRAIGVTFIWLVAELLIWGSQGRGLPYHWTCVLPPMVLTLAGWTRRELWPRFPWVGLIVPLLAVAVPLAHVVHYEACMIRDRIVSPKPSVASHLADELRPLIAPDDVVVVGFYDVSLYAYLGLRLPMPMAADHLQWLGEKVVAEQMAGLEASPPDWIILERDDCRASRSTQFELPNMSVYTNEPAGTGPRPVRESFARDLLAKLNYPLVLETRTHRVYQRPTGAAGAEGAGG